MLIIMYEEYYKSQLKEKVTISNLASEKKCSLFHHILLVSVTVFAIVISLQQSNQYSFMIRIVFLISTISLTIGIISCGIVYRGLTLLIEKASIKFGQELNEAIRENRKLNIVGAELNWFHNLCEYVCYYSLIISLFGYTTYTILVTLG